MFGYGPGEMLGPRSSPSCLEGLREGAPGARVAWAQSPSAPSMGAGAQLAGLRKDGTAFPVRVSLIPVAARFGQPV